jgi:hypothetical protein
MNWMTRASSLLLLLCACSERPDSLDESCASRQGSLVTFNNGVTNTLFLGETLYFDSDGTQRISRVALGGGAVETLVDSGATGEWGAGGGVLAWVSEPLHATPQSSTYIDQLHIRDASGQVHDFPPITDGSANQVQADAFGNVYWQPPDRVGVARWDHASGAQTLIAADVSGRLIVDQSQLYWLSATSILTTSSSGGEVRTLATVGDAAAGLYSDLAGSDAETLFVTQTTSGTDPLTPPPIRILAVPKSGGAPVVVAADVEPSFANLAGDRDYVYWVTVPRGTGDTISEMDLVRAPKSGGGSVEKLASSSDWIVAIGVDGCNLYWVSPRGLVSQPKP